MTILISIWLPLLSMLFLFVVKKSGANKRVALFMSTMNFLWALILVSIVQTKEVLAFQIGSVSSPFGITLVADKFSVFMLMISSFLFLIVTIYSTQSIKKATRKNGFFFFSFGILLGVNGSFLAGDIFSLFIWLEAIVFSSFTLITLGKQKIQLNKNRRYLVINLISILITLGGLALIYSQNGSLNMAVLSNKATKTVNFSAIFPGLILFFIGIAVKGALFPLYYWETTPSKKPRISSVTILLTGLLTNVGIYIVVRFYTLINHNSILGDHWLLWIGGLIMAIGVVAASTQNNLRKILTYHIITQVGYTITALGFNTLAGITAALFFIAHNMLCKTNTFLVTGWIHKSRGTLKIESLSDVFRQSRIWGFVFFISAFSLAGLPPLSGFAGKFLVLKAGVESNQIGVSLVALLVGLITLFTMLKVWLEVFWKKAPTQNLPPKPKIKDHWMLFSSITLAIAIVAMGVWAQPIINYCQSAAADLLNPAIYIQHVIGI